MSRFAGEGRPLVIYGAGGHGQVVAEAARLAGWDVRGFLDDEAGSERVLDLPVMSPGDPQAASGWTHVAIGNNDARSRIINELCGENTPLATIVHPTAYVAHSAVLAEGVFVGPGAVVHTSVNLGIGAIVNSSSIVEHHCVVGAFSHVAPGAALGGAARVGDFAMVGLRACVLPRKKVGTGTIVGAGAVVIDDVADAQTVVGIPARARRP